MQNVHIAKDYAATMRLRMRRSAKTDHYIDKLPTLAVGPNL